MRKRVIAGVLLVASLVGLYWFLSRNGALAVLMDGAALREVIARLGAWGPIAVVLLMASAIVWSPLPSAPIALAAGAAYGHTWGTIYVMIGAELGAVIAFGIARLFGQNAVRRWLGRRLSFEFLESQNALMAFVFVTRLLPFVSFDVVSYAAGLTPLTTWRFAIATLVGIAPMSFLLAHFGGEMSSSNAQRIVTAVMILFGFTLIPVFVKLILGHRRKRAGNHRSPNAEAESSLW